MRSLTISFILAALSAISCSKKAEQQAIMQPTTPTDTTKPFEPAKGEYTYLALGDSYTIGQSVPEADRYPVQTAGLLLPDSIIITSPEIIARTGWTTRDLLNAMAATPPSRTKYDFVSLLIGVNNQYQHLPQSTYKTEFTTLLTKAIALAGNDKTHVFVLSIPDYGVTPFGGGNTTISQEIDEFNAINRQVTNEYGCVYIDITPGSKDAANDLTLVASDGLHPSGKEYKKWAVKLAAAIKLSLH